MPAEFRRFVEAQIGPALNAELEFLKAAVAERSAAIPRLPRPAIILPRTTQRLSEVERLRQNIGRAKPSDTMSFEALRAVSTQAFVNSAIHAKRRGQIRWVCRKWDGRRTRPGWAVVHRRHFEADFDATTVPNLDERIRRVEPLLERPHPQFETNFRGINVKLVEDHLTLDRMVLNTLRVTAPHADTGVPYPTIQCTHVDGASIWPCDMYLDHYTRLNGLVDGAGNARLDDGRLMFYEFAGVDLRDVRYIQVEPGYGIESPIAFLGEDDIKMYIANPSPQMRHFGFGVSPCESSFLASMLHVQSFGYVAEYFRDGLSEMVGILAGEHYEPQDVQKMSDVLRTHHSGVGRRHHTPLLHILGSASDFDFKSTRSSNARDMAFPEVVHAATMMIHTHYGADPSETHTDTSNPAGGSKLNQPGRGDERSTTRDEGLFQVLDLLAEFWTEVIQEWDPDLRLVFMGLDDKDEKGEVELRTSRVGGWQTVNEARVEEGREPLHVPDDMLEMTGGLNPYDLAGPDAHAAMQRIFQGVSMKAQQEHQDKLLKQQQQSGQPPPGQQGQQGQPSGPHPFQQQDARPPAMQWQDGGDDGDEEERTKAIADFVVDLDS